MLVHRVRRVLLDRRVLKVLRALLVLRALRVLLGLIRLSLGLRARLVPKVR
jgi:hypothetical protein